ncbi:MAG: aminotransferase class I/II-fold pyridoxal phosphate-dependent enzyme [Candidatus Aminicenantes bacterium]|nr:aminotransferase class I/II-fold pyridoxal phosphate-dependent enzyme [Candidatus Aminicenantes bacterium]
MKFRLFPETVTPYRPGDENRRAGLRLDANENLWGPSPEVAAALRKLRPDDVAAYPDAGELTKNAARRFGASPGRLILSNGADEAIYALMSLFAGRGDSVLMPVPGFGIYTLAAGIHGARVCGVPLGPGFEFRRADIIKAITKKTRLVVLVTPNNPTGTEIKKTDVEAVVRRAARLGVPALLDETYAGFQNRTYSRMTRRFPNLIVVGSFSKYFALAGLRLGYVIAGPEVIAALHAILPPYSVNAAAMAAGRAALESTRHYENVRRGIVQERKKLAATLRKSGLTVFPSAANFLCVGVGPAAERVRNRLAASEIFVKAFPGAPRLVNCLRITVGRSAENRRLAEALESARPPEALLFDMDGVLVDVSVSYRRAIGRTVLHFSGGRVTPAEISRWKLRPEMNNDWDVAESLLSARGIDVPRSELVCVFQKFYFGEKGRSGFYRSERWLLPAPVLRRLAARYRLGIFTGRPAGEAKLALRRFRTERFFEIVIAREDAGNRQKPDPYGLRLALRRLGARRAVYFGDAPADMAAARAAGIPAVAVRPPGPNDVQAWSRRMKAAGASRFAENAAAAMEEFL